MQSLLRGLRVLALAGIVAAVVDPGCPRPRRPSVAVRWAGDVPEVARRRIGTVVANATAQWADLQSSPDGDGPQESGADLVVVAGAPGPVLESLKGAPAVLAVEVDDDAPRIEEVSVPPRVPVGLRTDVSVAVGGLPAGADRVSVTLVDRASGHEQGRVEREWSGSADGRLRVAVPWVASREGPQILRVVARTTGSTPQASAPADVSVAVVSNRVRVHVLEARPSWSARFARLALAAAPGVTVRTEVRPAPGLTVTRESAPRAGSGEEPEADVILVGGLEALSSADVGRLERAARDRGRAVVLVADEAPGGGSWQRLWPDAVGDVRSAPRLRTVDVGGHPWMVREYLTMRVSTSVRALAYFTPDASPAIAGRSLGAGRVILVGALDAWRWRDEPGVSYAHGWQALVHRLAADAVPPLSLTAWTGGARRERLVQADVVVRPDVTGAGDVDVLGDVEVGGRRHPLPLAPAGPNRWRAAIRPLGDDPHALHVRVQRGAELVASAQAVVDLSRTIPAAVWDDVERHQRSHDARATGEVGLVEAIDALRTSRPAGAWERQYATRTWWYAALVLGCLGLEWILRRAWRRR